MRVIVFGGRDYTNRAHIRSVLIALGFLVTDPSEITIVHGAARGADTTAGEEAQGLGYNVEPYPADWRKWGKIAGFIRNQQMAERGADRGIRFPGGRGTADMAHRCTTLGIPVQDERSLGSSSG